MKFAKTIIYVEDVEASLAFFEKAFGMKTSVVQPGSYGEVESGQTVIAFGSYASGQQHLPDGYVAGAPSSSTVSVELSLVSERVEADFARAIAAGAVGLRAPEVKPWGQISSYLRTPDGIIVDLASPAPAWT
ncbi:VOC family protein [Paenarthrobacter sp. Z7-10]|uniref:VOC family protein n=1 Tax=Paenarthrobacter sp. Z7-10 TaxID=2787635 RepID=UPI0022A9BEF3|nr:VOC family protein [Paenarthrobacter sp. Z7-10]MCZ2402217.1 VOC family protein [Paenarthrobacter sp. Z7-10]